MTTVTTVPARGAAVAAGLVADRLLGDPPDRWHPVARYGAAMAAVERRWWRDSRRAGVGHAAAGVALSAAAGRLTGTGTVATAALVATAAGGRSLDRAAAAVGRALRAGDIDAARRLLPTLVGRDPDRLDAEGVARAVVESVAENTVDAVVAPALWALAAGPAGAAAHRGVNTMDAMVGHRTARHGRYGWAAARLDDAAAWVPARLTAVLVAAVRPARAATVWRVVRRDAPAHPSPNAGVAEAAWAAALGLRLGGPTPYRHGEELRPWLGDGPPPTAADIDRARRLALDVAAALGTLLATPAACRAWQHRAGAAGRRLGSADRIAGGG